MNEQAELSGKVSLNGVIEYCDKDGNLIKTVPFTGTVPLPQEDSDGDRS